MSNGTFPSGNSGIQIIFCIMILTGFGQLL
jgi:hypothetical protein